MLWKVPPQQVHCLLHDKLLPSVCLELGSYHLQELVPHCPGHTTNTPSYPIIAFPVLCHTSQIFSSFRSPIHLRCSLYRNCVTPLLTLLLILHLFYLFPILFKGPEMHWVFKVQTQDGFLQQHSDLSTLLAFPFVVFPNIYLFFDCCRALILYFQESVYSNSTKAYLLSSSSRHGKHYFYVKMKMLLLECFHGFTPA